MSISTYAELKTAVSSWGATNEITDALFSDFVKLAEAKINRRLRVNEMVVPLGEQALASGVITKPESMVEIKALWSTGADQRTLEPSTLEFIQRQYPVSGTLRYFAIDGSSIRFNSTTGSVAGAFYAKVGALESSVNWLLLSSPDVYLWATLEQFYAWRKDKAGEADARARSDALIEEMNGRSAALQISGGPLIARAR